MKDWNEFTMYVMDGSKWREKDQENGIEEEEEEELESSSGLAVFFFFL